MAPSSSQTPICSPQDHSWRYVLSLINPFETSLCFLALKVCFSPERNTEEWFLWESLVLFEEIYNFWQFELYVTAWKCEKWELKMTLAIGTHWLLRQHATENKISALGVACTYPLLCAMSLLYALIALQKTELLSSNFTSNWNTIGPEAQQELKCFSIPLLLRIAKTWWRSSQIPDSLLEKQHLLEILVLFWVC